MDENSLAHTKWDCKYHIVFAPKLRRQEIYGAKKKEIGKILRLLCERYEVQIIEANACKDHIYVGFSTFLNEYFRIYNNIKIYISNNILKI